MLRIDALEIDDHVLDKIESRHGVPFDEVEEACYSQHRHVRRGRQGLYKVFSQTEAGRHCWSCYPTSVAASGRSSRRAR
jgi:hypothetical protein